VIARLPQRGVDRYGRVKDMNFTVEGGNVPVTI
jgi:hypothetical protein